MPALKKKYLKYDNFKDQTITDIFTPEEMDGSVKLEVYELSSSLLMNEGGGKLSLKRLPVEAQVSVVYAIAIDDFDEDGNMDIVLGGNLYHVKPEVGRYDASYGTFLKGDGKGDFKSIRANASGLFLDGEIRDLTTMEVAGKKYLLAARNSNSLLTLKVK